MRARPNQQGRNSPVRCIISFTEETESTNREEFLLSFCSMKSCGALQIFKEVYAQYQALCESQVASLDLRLINFMVDVNCCAKQLTPEELRLFEGGFHPRSVTAQAVKIRLGKMFANRGVWPVDSYLRERSNEEEFPDLPSIFSVCCSVCGCPVHEAIFEDSDRAVLSRETYYFLSRNHGYSSSAIGLEIRRSEEEVKKGIEKMERSISKRKIETVVDSARKSINWNNPACICGMKKRGAGVVFCSPSSYRKK